MDKLLNWLGDKELVILVILCFGIYSLHMEAPEAMTLIEKLSYGLFGVVTGSALKK